jgi:hypothetical protein
MTPPHATHRRYHSQTPPLLPCVPPCSGWQAMHQAAGLWREQPHLKKKAQVNVQDSRVSPPTCGAQYKRKKYPRERSRSTLPPSPEGSRSAASATAAAASARALASSALSSRTSAIALCSAGIVCDACDCGGVFRLPVDFPSDLRVLLL